MLGRPNLTCPLPPCTHTAWATTRTSSSPTGRRPSTRSTKWACTKTCSVAFTPTVRLSGECVFTPAAAATSQQPLHSPASATSLCMHRCSSPPCVLSGCLACVLCPGGEGGTVQREKEREEAGPPPAVAPSPRLSLHMHTHTCSRGVAACSWLPACCGA